MIGDVVQPVGCGIVNNSGGIIKFNGQSKSNGRNSIYGVKWQNGNSNPSWTRCADSENFSDPNPYYAGMSGTPSSPFDTLYPWSEIKIVDDTNGKVVYIPKFWFKWEIINNFLYLYISDHKESGFYVSPAHADRGDGVGERDYVYIARYKCRIRWSNTTNGAYRSDSNVQMVTSASQDFNVSELHNFLGSNYWCCDSAMYWTIKMLYLVEFANWDVSVTIGSGYGCQYTSEGGDGMHEYTGRTDSMPYHTGTTTSRDNYMGYSQYRYIESLWGQYKEIISSTYTIKDNTDGVFISNNPAYNTAEDANKATFVYSLPTTSSYMVPSSFNICNVPGFEYIIYPSTFAQMTWGGNFTTYTTDTVSYPISAYRTTGSNPTNHGFYMGGSYGYYGSISEVAGGKNRWGGLFYLSCTQRNNGSGGLRFMILPNK